MLSGRWLDIVDSSQGLLTLLKEEVTVVIASMVVPVYACVRV